MSWGVRTNFFTVLPATVSGRDDREAPGRARAAGVERVASVEVVVVMTSTFRSGDAVVGAGVGVRVKAWVG